LPLQPLRDEKGSVVPHDHPGILPEHGVIRRISEHFLVDDDKAGGRRISSMAFKASSGVNAGLSIDLQHEIEEAGIDARVYVTTPRWIGSVRFQARQLRGEGFIVGPNPIAASPGIDANPYHGEVWGTFTKSKQRSLLALCEWFVPIDGVLIDR
jgi:hypothetical protein